MEALPNCYWKAFQLRVSFRRTCLPLTIYDVAKKAGVGIGTVSRAINNSPQINPQTKERVQRIIKEMNYQPHALAQSLARKKTFTIASVVPFFTNYFYVELLKSVQKALSKNNYDLILYSVDRMDRLSDTLDRVLSDRRSDGVLLISIGMTEEYARKFMETPVPVVVIDNRVAQLDSITVANQQAAQSATEHLIGLGHTRIGMVNGVLSSYPAQQRLEGFKKAMVYHGLDFDKRLLIICDAGEGEHGFNEHAGYGAMKKFISSSTDLPTAFFVASDVQALGVMRAAKESGIRIPEDLALVGFDDIEFSKFVGLTTMRQPIAEMGYMAVERLIQRIELDSDGGLHQELHAELIVRETCGAHAGFKVDA
jgi:LacI family transcriptional regulator